MTILVTGATGNVGRLVARELAGRGVPVRALTRDPAKASAAPAGFPAGVEWAVGDLARPEGLAEALAGVDRLLLFPYPDTADEVVALAKAAGVRRIVVLSSAAVTSGYDTTFHLPVEQAVEASGLEWTFIRPGEFAVNKLELWGPSIRSERTVYDTDPDWVGSPVHEADIGDAIATALLDDGHAGRAYTFNGPESLTVREQVAVLARELGEEVRVQEVTPLELRERYLAQGGFAAASADFMLGFETYDGEVVEEAEEFDLSEALVEASAEIVTGRPARTFAEWVREHAEAFR
ncbi:MULTISPECIES: NAD(P)H-binding protein [Streptomyces]|uniref:NmrA family transcriptional regulator n=1 Tax=Streptomyces tsukubensis (strain DSM 42081 / NBRC 108919 / NRRL 18488 / 9993) TaxID=1114943 RepID=I2N3W3_STRT9|nr:MULTISPECIES: NAD(P)H-binding protein [Streptomyces]AZK95777.1 NmrA family transcriptional regulator [Streptomyces tsukubensis]EIF91710.1 NmrA family protein [Streptomyces tsukubensis NRRL18488]MYS65655.1 NAD(P)H-binding protein [Streptomyces sp. SID5473]QKM68197.1 NmrA family transcriptional regulator [Streptomyces tsukubensis NRRL18488]TAI44599.1 NmrA family transcriptional regulator [Streptomyces tsukubensis]